LALTHGLRGNDAVHAATALALQEDGVVAVTGDRALLAAFGALGLATIDPAGPDAMVEPDRPGVVVLRAPGEDRCRGTDPRIGRTVWGASCRQRPPDRRSNARCASAST